MLKKSLYTLPLLAMILLSACSGQVAAVMPAASVVPTTAAESTVAAPVTNTEVATQNATTDGSATAEPTPARMPTLPVSTAPATCKVVDSLLPEIPEQYRPSIPPVDEKTDWIEGPSDAVITLIEYSDFQCPYCQQIANELDEFMAKQNGQVRLVYRHFPLQMHDKSSMAARASEAAGLQGKFWEMHDFLFKPDNWSVWTALESEAAFVTYLKEKAAPAISGLDQKKFTADLESDAIKTKVNSALTEVIKLASDPNNGLQGTPTFYLITGGQTYTLSANVILFENVLNMVKLNSRLYKECPPQVVDSAKEYTATIKTEKGDIVIKLFPDKAPTTVNSFIFLAKEGYFDGNSFHRVISNFVAQTGDPSDSGLGGPGYEFDTEIAEGVAFDKEGMVGMARGQNTDTNGSQFFITMDKLPNLDRLYTIFGEVTSGMDVVKKLTLRDVSSDPNPPAGDKIISVTIEEK
ncbi:MAG: peptidylprolyl isomerase [Anaerolineae bacterium]|nr:peptidylprolyl isomerase [Anaerolineae bacterium]